MPTPHHPPAVVRRALRTLGADIHNARRRRQLSMAVVAERAFTSRSTLQKVEAGDTSVSIGIYAGVLQALGLLDGLSALADIGNDPVGQALSSAALPKRVRAKIVSATPDEDAVKKRNGDDEEAAVAARAAHRRATWVGSHHSLADSAAPEPPVSAADRLVAVREVSRRAYAIGEATETSSRIPARDSVRRRGS